MDGDTDLQFPEGLRLFVVDDDPVFLKVVRAMLLLCNYQVTTCVNPHSALTILREHGKEFDLLLVDVHMPEMSGFELLRIVNDEFDLPVIMMSIDERPEIMKKCIQLGACFFLAKPLDMNTVKNLWQHVVANKKIKSLERGVNLGKALQITDHATQHSQAETEKNVKGKDVLTAKGDGKKDPMDPKEVSMKGECSKVDKGKKIKERENDVRNDDDDDQPKKKQLNWRPFLEKKFQAAIDILGEGAVPSKILKLMNVEGVTRHHVASHLQKYRLKKRNEALTPKFPLFMGPTFPIPYPQLNCAYGYGWNASFTKPPVPCQSQIPSTFNPYANASHVQTVQSSMNNLQLNRNAQLNVNQRDSGSVMAPGVTKGKCPSTQANPMYNFPRTGGVNPASFAAATIQQQPPNSIVPNQPQQCSSTTHISAGSFDLASFLSQQYNSNALAGGYFGGARVGDLFSGATSARSQQSNSSARATGSSFEATPIKSQQLNSNAQVPCLFGGATVQPQQCDSNAQMTDQPKENNTDSQSPEGGGGYSFPKKAFGSADIGLIGEVSNDINPPAPYDSHGESTHAVSDYVPAESESVPNDNTPPMQYPSLEGDREFSAALNDTNNGDYCFSDEEFGSVDIELLNAVLGDLDPLVQNNSDEEIIRSVSGDVTINNDAASSGMDQQMQNPLPGMDFSTANHDAVSSDTDPPTNHDSNEESAGPVLDFMITNGGDVSDDASQLVQDYSLEENTLSALNNNGSPVQYDLHEENTPSVLKSMSAGDGIILPGEHSSSITHLEQQRDGDLAVENIPKFLEQEDFGEKVEKFAFEDEEWSPVLEDAFDFDFDFDFDKDFLTEL